MMRFNLPLWAMHIPDGFLSPGATLCAAFLAILGVGLALRRLNMSVGDRLVPLVGVTAAAIFAGQMVNFPLIGLPASGHLMGGVLAAVLLGPWGGVLALTAVLMVQCLVFGDGGLTALGANVVNMALIGSGCGYVLFDQLRRLLAGPRGTVIAAAVASWFAVTLSAIAFSIEMAGGGEFEFSSLAALMLMVHAVVGLGEAMITGLAIAWLVRVRPELIYGGSFTQSTPTTRGYVTAAGLTIALAIAIFAAPLASELEDGLESVAVQMQFADRAVANDLAPLTDYQLCGVSEWLMTSALATSLVGVLGTTLTWGVAWGMARSVSTSRS
ncbi:MAG: cobalt transporter CbiM [Planctomycetaceae bacterium]|nr:cobalt transporter CbiM [Planctomycetaceae bacterium]